MLAAERTPVHIGRYEIVRVLGRGAMGRVLLAVDPVLERSVAVKLLRDDLVIPPEQQSALIERMRQEARASARVTHPNIVALFDMGEDPELGLYLVFEYAQGITLKDRLTQAPLGAANAATIARELGDALTTAHEKGVVHRDIKPENVILTATGSKIADFGIARVPDSTLTRDGGLLGTPAYSAPEAISNGFFSAATDQFSMAATLYEAISRRRAFPGEDAVSVASRITTDEVPPIALSCGLSPEVDAVLRRGMSKDPRTRYPSAREFGRALANALDQPRHTLPTVSNELPTPSFGSSGRARHWISAIALGAAIGAVAMRLASDPDNEAAPSAPPGQASAESVAIGWLAPAPRKARGTNGATRGATAARSEGKTRPAKRDRTDEAAPRPSEDPDGATPEGTEPPEKPQSTAPPAPVRSREQELSDAEPLEQEPLEQEPLNQEP